jgi:FMNH2-dependent dimethyl sulfone monooxygenase
MSRQHTRLFGPNKFKLGMFGQNCNNGLTMTKAPEAWDNAWDNNVKAARLADDAGVEFILPIGRWHGYKGDTDTEGTTYETLTWATGLLASTKEICVCGTLHVRFLNPVFAAKQMVTADHVGQGRFGLNIVSGWNVGEHEMFGIELLHHDIRYDLTEEWVRVVKRIWTEDEPFDFDGKYFKLRDVLLKPKPWGGSHPILISAGNSREGRGFGARHVDCLFTSIVQDADLPAYLAEARAVGSAEGRSPGIYASGHMYARPTAKEARDFYHYIVHDNGDWRAAEHAAHIRTAGRETPFAKLQALKERLISGLGTWPIVGSYDECAAEFKRLSDAGLDGMALGLVNYIDEFPHFMEVVGRMEKAGLRLPAR